MTTAAPLAAVGAANLSQQTVAILVIGVMLGLFAIIMGGSFLRSRRPSRELGRSRPPPRPQRRSRRP